MENRFKEGDRVRLKDKSFPRGAYDGIVVKINRSLWSPALVRFNGWGGGHNNSHNKDGFVSEANDCWWLREGQLEMVSAEPQIAKSKIDELIEALRQARAHEKAVNEKLSLIRAEQVQAEYKAAALKREGDDVRDQKNKVVRARQYIEQELLDAV